jgi:hypothetical protein
VKAARFYCSLRVSLSRSSSSENHTIFRGEENVFEMSKFSESETLNQQSIMLNENTLTITHSIINCRNNIRKVSVGSKHHQLQYGTNILLHREMKCKRIRLTKEIHNSNIWQGWGMEKWRTHRAQHAMLKSKTKPRSWSIERASTTHCGPSALWHRAV